MPQLETGLHLKILSTSSMLPLHLALDSFLVSREALRVTPSTLNWYKSRLGRFLAFLEGQGIVHPKDIIPHHIRTFLIGLQRRGLRDGKGKPTATLTAKPMGTRHVEDNCIRTSDKRSCVMNKVW